MPIVSVVQFPLGVNFSLAAETYPLDDVTGATAGYGLRLLRAAYAGNCIKVRRSSDNTTMDIGFVGYVLDFAALSGFVGGSDGFVETWYDQSGNTRDLVQATANLQPQILSSGSYFTAIGGYPTMHFTGTRYLDSSIATSNFITGTAGTTFHLWQADTISSADQGNVIWGNIGGWCGLLVQDVSGTIHIRAEGGDPGEDYADDSPYAADTSYVTAWQHDSGNLLLYVLDGTAQASTAHGTETTLSANMTVGRNISVTGASSIFNGYIGEILTYDTALSGANIDTIGADMATPYGLTWA